MSTTPNTQTTPKKQYTSKLLANRELKRSSESVAATVEYPGDLFSGKVFILLGFGFQETSSLKSIIKKCGGELGFQITKNVHYLITTKEEAEKQSSKIQSAIKLGTVEILSAEFVHSSVQLKAVDLNDKFRLSKQSAAGVDESNPLAQLAIPVLQSSDALKKGKKEVNLNHLELIAKPKRVFKLFISSTFLDMVSEREYIMYLVPQLREYCHSRSIEFTFVDMRWGITNEEMKRKNTIATCLQEVATSNYFISLLGNRYGWSSGSAYEESFDLASVYFSWLKQANTKNKSITELEILQALQKPAGSSRHSFFYLKTTSQESSEIENGDDQSSDAIERLSQLKQYIVKNNLSFQKYQKVSDLVLMIFKDLTKRIDLDFPSDAESNSSMFEVDQHVSQSQLLLKHYVNNNPMLMTKLNQFVVSSQLRSSMDCGNSHVMVVTSPSGNGKSTFLSNWVHSVSQSKVTLDPKKSLLVMVHIGLTPKSKSRWEILRQLYYIIKTHYQVNVPVSEHSSTALLEEMNYWFDVATRDGRKLVWILDGIENLDKLRPDETPGELLQWLPSRFTSNVKIVLSTASDSPCFEYVKATYSNILPLKGFETLDEVLQYAKNFCKFYAKELDPVQIELIKKFEKACASPLFLATVMQELLNIGNFHNLNEKLVGLLSMQFTLALYVTIIQKWETDPNYPPNMVQNILSLIYLSEIGLYEYEILEILDLKSSFGFFSSIRSIFQSSSFFSVQSQYLRYAIKLKYFPKDNDDDNPTSVKLKSDLASYFVASLDKNKYSESETSRRVEYIPKLLKSINSRASLQEFLLSFKHLVHLISTETSRRSTVLYWTWLGFSKEELVKHYQQKYAAYQNTRPPMEELAQITFHLGKLLEYISFYDLAFEFIDSSKEYHVQLYGDLHSKVLIDDQTLLHLSIKRSKFDTAEYLAERSLAASETLFGKEHIGTFESLQLNGLVKKKKTAYKEAEEFYQSALKILFRFLGYSEQQASSTLAKDSKLFNSKIADLYNNLGDIYRKLAQFDRALVYYNRTIEIYSNLRDSKHPSFSEIHKNLGLVAKKQGNYKEATKHYQDALDIIKINFGEDHVDFGLILCDMADTMRKEDNFGEADKLYARSLEILLAKLGEKNIEVAEVYNDRGLIQKKLGHYKEAIDLYKKAISIGEEVLDKSHQKLSFYNLNLADCYRKLGDYKKAEVLYAKCLIITQDHLGSDHPEVAEVLNSLGLVYKKQSKYSSAEKEYKRAIAIAQRSLSIDHPKVGIYSVNLADVYRKQAKYEQAKTIYNKALALIDKALGKNHSEYAEVLYGIGLNEMCQEKFDESINHISSAIDIVGKELGKTHAKVGIYMNSLAETKIARLKSLPTQMPSHGELDEIRQMYNDSFEILLVDLGDKHPEIADIYVNRAEFEFSWGSHQLCKEYFEKALEIIKEVFNEDHPKYKSISDRIRYF